MMLRLLPLAPLVLATAASAQSGADSSAMEIGQTLYEDNCSICHQDNGRGDSPNFPPLAGNEILEDVGRVVSNIHEGQGNMPPFPDFTAEEVAAITTYIRNSWDNSLGSVQVDEVAAVLSDLEDLPPKRTIWDGVYTEAQAERGEAEYLGPCGLCHGRALNGAPTDPDMVSSPPLARAKFLRNWDGRSLATLFQYTRGSMPKSNPGYMSDETYIDIIAYMLAVSDVPPGDEPLPVDPRELARITIVE